MSSPVPPPPDPPAPGAAPTSAGPPRRPPRVLAGRYRLDLVIGKGSMGTVWAATDQVLHRQVAIKEIDFPPGTPAGERAQLEARTLREARAIAALSNPYVITLFDILTLEQGPVIVMELLRARSLAEILRQVGRLPDGQAATIGVAVASGLIAAHTAGITHRDVKPGNVLICDDGRIKLTDFGIARSSAEQTMTATGLLLGSPAYIAPEVANGVPVGPISDAWSLGGLLFATVEGRPPFDQGTAIATLTSVVKDPVPPHPHSGRLGAVVSGLLVKTPALRMRLDRALVIMRTVADDPSGMNLATVSRIPRVEDTAPGLPPINDATGSAPAPAGRSLPSASSPPLRATARPPLPPGRDPALPSGSATPLPERSRPRSSPAAAIGSPAGSAAPPRPRQGPTGTGWGNRPPARPWSPGTDSGPPPASSAANPRGVARPGTSPPITSLPATSPPVTSLSAVSQAMPSRSAPSPSQPSRPVTDGPADSAARDSRQLPLAALQQAASPAQALPPPPWAPEDAAALPPLPDDPGAESRDIASPARHSTRFRVVAAVLVAIIAAILGFLGVRIIADLASQSASAADARSTSAAPSVGPVRAGDPADRHPSWYPPAVATASLAGVV